MSYTSEEGGKPININKKKPSSPTSTSWRRALCKQGNPFGIQSFPSILSPISEPYLYTIPTSIYHLIPIHISLFRHPYSLSKPSRKEEEKRSYGDPFASISLPILKSYSNQSLHPNPFPTPPLHPPKRKIKEYPRLPTLSSSSSKSSKSAYSIGSFGILFFPPYPSLFCLSIISKLSILCTPISAPYTPCIIHQGKTQRNHLSLPFHYLLQICPKPAEFL